MVWKAARLPGEFVKDVAKYVGHVSGWRVIATDELLAHGEDWTERLREAAR